MKKLLSFFAIIGIILASNCSSIPENDDPIIGYWTAVEVSSSETSKTSLKKEWIFNDAYLGRYHTYNNQILDIVTDFRWSKEGDIYTIEYPGLENKLNDKAIMTESEGIVLLEETDGEILATKE